VINPDASAMPVRVTSRAWLLPRQVLIGLVKGYRLLLSPWLGSSCRFEPTCSIYAIESYERHGAVVGSALTASRLLRCQPWCEGGHDPVPVAARLSSSRLFTGLIARATKKSSS
jgi:putative membrane protein insertion efficiency factor